MSVLKGPGKMSGRAELLSVVLARKTRHPLLVLVECELHSEEASTLEGTNAIFVNKSLPAMDSESLARDV